MTQLSSRTGDRICTAATSLPESMLMFRIEHGMSRRGLAVWLGLPNGGAVECLECRKTLTVARPVLAAFVRLAGERGYELPADVAAMADAPGVRTAPSRPRRKLGEEVEEVSPASYTEPITPYPDPATVCPREPRLALESAAGRHGRWVIVAPGIGTNPNALYPGRVVVIYDDPMTNLIPAGHARLVHKLVTYARRQSGWLVEMLSGKNAPYSGQRVEKWICS